MPWVTLTALESGRTAKAGTGAADLAAGAGGEGARKTEGAALEASTGPTGVSLRLWSASLQLQIGRDAERA